MNTLAWADVDDGLELPALVRKATQRTVGLHAHTFYEIVYVLDGFCHHTRNDATALLLAGDMLAIRPGDVHGYRTQRDMRIYNFLFLPEALGDALSEVAALPGMAEFFLSAPSDAWRLHAHLSLADRERVQALLEDIRTEREARLPGWKLRVKALLTEFMVLFSRIFSARFPEDTPLGYSGYVTEAVGRMEAEYMGNLTVAGIARDIGISPDHLARQFKKTIGLSPIEYLRRYRFARAVELLRQQTPVGEVTRAVGFHHLSHFSREFKTVFGMTPSAFQKQARERGLYPTTKER